MVWDDVENEYELWWDNGPEDGKFTLLGSTEDTSFKVDNITKVGEIKFKVRNKTPCHSGKFSQATTVMFELAPTIPD